MENSTLFGEKFCKNPALSKLWNDIFGLQFFGDFTALSLKISQVIISVCVPA